MLFDGCTALSLANHGLGQTQDWMNDIYPMWAAAHGKQAGEAKLAELAGWPYPRHLAGRLFSVVVHGDVEGAKNVRRLLVEWLAFMRLAPATARAQLDRYIGYWQPYATSLALDRGSRHSGTCMDGPSRC